MQGAHEQPNVAEEKESLSNNLQFLKVCKNLLVFSPKDAFVFGFYDSHKSEGRRVVRDICRYNPDIMGDTIQIYCAIQTRYKKSNY